MSFQPYCYCLLTCIFFSFFFRWGGSGVERRRDPKIQQVAIAVKRSYQTCDSGTSYMYCSECYVHDTKLRIHVMTKTFLAKEYNSSSWSLSLTIHIVTGSVHQMSHISEKITATTTQQFVINMAQTQYTYDQIKFNKTAKLFKLKAVRLRH